MGMRSRIRALLAAAAILFTGLAVGATPASAEPPTLTQDDVEAWVDGVVPALLEREGIPGAAVSVVHGGEVLALRGYGMADLGSRDRAPELVDPARTLMRVGSISKVGLAVAVMQLVERGELDLDEPITTYTDLAPAQRFPEPVTMRHLLTHTAGYEEVIRNVVLQSPARIPRLEEYLREQAPQQIAPAGTTPAYSNYGYALAGDILARVSGVDTEHYLQTHVLDRAGATSATYEQPLPGGTAAARPYAAGSAEPIGFELVGAWPAGSLSASAADMAALMIGLLDTESSPLLGPDAMAQMRAPGYAPGDLGGLAHGHQMTLGLFEQDRGGHRILGHGGDLIHSHAAFQIYPDGGTGIFIGLNGSGRHADSSVVLRNALLDGFTDRYYPPEHDPEPVLATSAEHARAVAGTYVVSRRGESTFMRAFYIASTVQVHADGDALVVPVLVDTAGEAVELRETEPWVFSDESGTHRVAVAVDGAIALMPALTLLPAPGWYAPGIIALAGALVTLAVALAAWPLRALLGWRLGVPLVLARTDLRLRRAGLLGALCAMAAVGLWAWVGAGLLGGRDVPDLCVRAAQGVTLLAAAGVLPAGWRAVRAWQQRSWSVAGTSTAVAAAFAALALFAVAGGLLNPSLNY